MLGDLTVSDSKGGIPRNYPARTVIVTTHRGKVNSSKGKSDGAVFARRSAKSQARVASSSRDYCHSLLPRNQGRFYCARITAVQPQKTIEAERFCQVFDKYVTCLPSSHGKIWVLVPCCLCRRADVNLPRPGPFARNTTTYEKSSRSPLLYP